MFCGAVRPFDLLGEARPSMRSAADRGPSPGFSGTGFSRSVGPGRARGHRRRWAGMCPGGFVLPGAQQSVDRTDTGMGTVRRGQGRSD